MRARKSKKPAVGYGRPPLRTRFKRGQSGNPKGRKKGSKNKVSHQLALDKLLEIMQSKRSPAALQVKAAEIILGIIERAALGT